MARVRGSDCGKCRGCRQPALPQQIGNEVPYCADCLAAMLGEWSGHVSAKSTASRLRSKYNLTIDDHGRMFTEQRGLCAICRDPARSSKSGDHGTGLVVDHCHVTGKVRGLLCSRCNAALGLFADNLGWLAAASRYLNSTTKPEIRRAKKRASRARTQAHIEARRAAKANGSTGET